MSTDPSAAGGGLPVVALLGTGIMGTGMAHSLLRAGLPLRVWNRTAARAEPLAADGAQVCATAAEAVRGADVLITVLHDSGAVTAALEAAAEALTPGQVWLQCSTVGPAATPLLAARAAELGVAYLDAPVSGTRTPAENGALTVLVAGPAEAQRTAAPVLDAIGARTVRAGDEPGAASRLKLVLNTWVINLVSSVAEALNAADALDVDPRAFLAAVTGGPLDSPYLQSKSAALLDGDLAPDFAVGSALKDAGLILAAADAAGVRLDLLAAAETRLRRASDGGHGYDDVIATYYAGLSQGE